MNDALETKFVDMTERMADAVEKFNGLAEAQQKAQEDSNDLRKIFITEQEKTALELVELRAFLTNKHGKSGADDWRRELQNFIVGVFYAKQGLPLPDGAKLANDHEIKAADFTTTTGATAGYLVPDFLMPDIMELARIHGNLYPLIGNKYTLPAGASLKVNSELALPSAYWRRAQGGAITEASATYAQDTITSVLCGSIVKITNELLSQPGVGFADSISVKMVSAVVRAMETGIISGDTTGADDTDPPSEGIINDSGTNSQTDISNSTPAKLLAFLTECVADYEASSRMGENVLILSPAKLFAMAQDALTATGLTSMLTFGDIHKGIPPTFFGYPIIMHPGAQVSTTHYGILTNPGALVLGESGQMAIDLNPLGDGWSSNESWLRVMTHVDWSMGQPKAHHYAEYT